MVLSFENWKGAKVNPTTHAVAVLPVKGGPKAEPTSPLLVATLVHPDRKASIGQVKYSNDGKRLFASGYPSGVVQLFDVETRKELRRIEGPKGYRGSMEYALLTPDWKTLYVTDEKKRKVVPVETDGKKDHRIEYSGHVLAWDAASGKPKDGFAPEPNCGASFARLSPDGTRLVVVEFETCLASKREDEKRTTWAIDTKTGKKVKLGDGYLVPHFHPDGRTAFVENSDYEAKTSVLKRIDLTTGKVLASRDTPDKGLNFAVNDVSPDGKLAAFCLTGKRGMAPITHVVDAETLKDVATLTGNADPDTYGYHRREPSVRTGKSSSATTAKGVSASGIQPRRRWSAPSRTANGLGSNTSSARTASGWPSPRCRRAWMSYEPRAASRTRRTCRSPASRCTTSPTRRRSRWC